MINWAQQNAGTHTPLLMTYEDITHLEGKWIQQLQEDLSQINSKIYIHDVWTLPATRENDKHLMDVILQYVQSPTQQRKLNYCRLYLQVTHLSDITTSDGRKLHPEMLQQPSKFNNQHKHLLWPEQGKPNTITWELWKKMLRTTLCYDNDILKQLLGKWLLSYKKWHAYYNSKDDIVVLFTSKWTKHAIIQKTRTYITILTKGDRTKPPDRDETYMLPITDLTPHDQFLHFTRQTKYELFVFYVSCFYAYWS